jgi:hypothetical protein
MKSPSKVNAIAPATSQTEGDRASSPNNKVASVNNTIALIPNVIAPKTVTSNV